MDRFDRLGLNGRVGVTSLLSIDNTQCRMLEIIARVFEPAGPAAENMTVYRHARDPAEQYWGLVSTDTRVSADFRVIAKTCGNTLAALPRTGAYAYTDDKAGGPGL